MSQIQVLFNVLLEVTFAYESMDSVWRKKNIDYVKLKLLINFFKDFKKYLQNKKKQKKGAKVYVQFHKVLFVFALKLLSNFNVNDFNLNKTEI